MELEKYIEEMNNLGYRVSRQGKAKIEGLEKYVMILNKGNIVNTIITEVEDTGKIFQSLYENKESGVSLNLTNNGLRTYEDIHEFYYLNNSNFEGEYDFEKMNAVFVRVYSWNEEANPIEFDFNSEAISYKGMATETDLYNYLEHNLEVQIQAFGKTEYLTPLLILKEYGVRNDTKAEDVEEYLTEVKTYLSRYNKRYQDTKLEDILEEIIDKVTMYNTVESVITHIYDYPVLDSSYDTEDGTKETQYENISDTAKKIKKSLRKKFKNTKFSVKSLHGSRIDVRWKDYPTMGEVKEVVNQYDGKHTQQTYGDYGHDKVDAGYIDPENGKRYTSPSYLFCEIEYSDKMRDLNFYLVHEHLVSAYGIDAHEYKADGGITRRVRERLIENNEEYKSINSDEDVDRLLKEYKQKFEDNFIERIENDIRKEVEDEFKVGVKHLTLGEWDIKDTPKVRVIAKEKDVNKIEYLLKSHPVIKGYHSTVEIKSGEQDSKNKKGYNFRESRDGKDEERLSRFIGYLSENKVKSRAGTNTKLPRYVVVNIGKVELSFAPTFVVYVNGKKLLYDKNNEEHSYELLQKSISQLIKSGVVSNKEDVNTLMNVVKAYMRSNDLRYKKV